MVIYCRYQQCEYNSVVRRNIIVYIHTSRNIFVSYLTSSYAASRWFVLPRALHSIQVCNKYFSLLLLVIYLRETGIR